MDPSAFDRLSHAFAASPTRRAALAGIVATVAAAFGRHEPAGAASTSRICRPLGELCMPNRGLDCCRNAACRKGRCRCPKRTRRCGNRCLPTSKCCRNSDCPGPKRCVKGRCRSRSCRGNQCPCAAGQKRCQDRCIPSSACCGGCAADQNCVNGTCIAKRCGAGAPCRVFVTASRHSSDLGGVAGADAICQTAANASALTQGGTYKAWIAGSTDASAPFHRFTNLASTGPYELVDGTLVANDWDDLTTNKSGDYLRAAINLSENGTGGSLLRVWTNVEADTGLPASDSPGENCEDWTLADGNIGDNTVIVGRFGWSYLKNESWTADGAALCSNNPEQPRYLYCFEQG